MVLCEKFLIWRHIATFSRFAFEPLPMHTLPPLCQQRITMIGVNGTKNILQTPIVTRCAAHTSSDKVGYDSHSRAPTTYKGFYTPTNPFISVHTSVFPLPKATICNHTISPIFGSHGSQEVWPTCSLLTMGSIPCTPLTSGGHGMRCPSWSSASTRGTSP